MSEATHILPGLVCGTEVGGNALNTNFAVINQRKASGELVLEPLKAHFGSGIWCSRRRVLLLVGAK